MKKLLGILGAAAITGTAAPTIIAASSYIPQAYQQSAKMVNGPSGNNVERYYEKTVERYYEKSIMPVLNNNNISNNNNDAFEDEYHNPGTDVQTNDMGANTVQPYNPAMARMDKIRNTKFAKPAPIRYRNYRPAKFVKPSPSSYRNYGPMKSAKYAPMAHGHCAHRYYGGSTNMVAGPDKLHWNR